MEAPMPSNKTNAKLGFRITNCFNLKLVIAVFPFRKIFNRRPYDFVDYFEPAGDPAALEETLLGYSRRPLDQSCARNKPAD